LENRFARIILILVCSVIGAGRPAKECEQLKQDDQMLTSERRLALFVIVNAHDIVTQRLSAQSFNSKATAMLTREDWNYLRKRHLYGLARLGLQMPHDTMSRIYEVVWSTQRGALQQAIDALQRESVEPLVYKGAEIAERYGASTAFALRGDCDIMIRKEDVAKAKAVLAELGYIQGNFNTVDRTMSPLDASRLAGLEEGRYVLPSFGRVQRISRNPFKLEASVSEHPFYGGDGQDLVVVALDLSIGLDREIDADRFLSSSVPSAFPGARAMRPDDHLWYLCSLFYIQVQQHRQNCSLSKLADIVLLLSGERALDWAYIIDTAQRLAILPSMYYTLAFLNAASPSVNIPDWVLEELNPLNGPRARDFGWQLHKLFGMVEPIPTEFLV
jgi:hypothetical protein